MPGAGLADVGVNHLHVSLLGTNLAKALLTVLTLEILSWTILMCMVRLVFLANCLIFVGLLFLMNSLEMRSHIRLVTKPPPTLLTLIIHTLVYRPLVQEQSRFTSKTLAASLHVTLESFYLGVGGAMTNQVLLGLKPLPSHTCQICFLSPLSAILTISTACFTPHL